MLGPRELMVCGGGGGGGGEPPYQIYCGMNGVDTSMIMVICN